MSGEDTPTTALPERTYLLVRSCRQIPLNDQVVGIGWDDVNFSDFPDAEILLKQMWDDGWETGSNTNTIRRFCGLSKGDLVVVPWWGTIAIGEAVGEATYNSRFSGMMGANQQRVRFPIDYEGNVSMIARTDLSEALQRRLKIKRTVADLWEFSDEIEKHFTAIDSGKRASYILDIESKQAELLESFKSQLLQNIQSGKTGLQTGGLGMESLIAELLRCDGFEVTHLSKQHFGSGIADADLKASKTNSLRTDEFLIQVKHHGGRTDDHGIKQLIAINESDFPDYSQHQLVFVTSGSLDREEQTLAAKHDIITKDGSELIDWILDALPQLDRRIQAQLGILNVPHIHS
ncbi:hypothetical protein VDG1235_4497 [Verrucomicrobiia bacterium DG1235]|nr:hypothetical protein VDG1235_4497 [Verrucomicrobiae bacterium DG1235]